MAAIKDSVTPQFAPTGVGAHASTSLPVSSSTGAVSASGNGDGESSRARSGEIEEIEDDITRTRAEMDRTFDALGRKLAPSQLLEDGWDMVRENAGAGASRLWQVARDHPLPALAIGAALGWLVVESRRGGSPRPERWQAGGGGSGKLQEQADRVAGTVKEQGSRLGGRLQRQAGRARRGVGEMVDERPLAVGAAALAIGVLAGLALPSTRREDEMWGDTRDGLLESAREAGRDALEKGKEAALEAVERVKESVREQELTPEQLAEKARHVAQDAVGSLRNAEKSFAHSLDGSAQP